MRAITNGPVWFVSVLFTANAMADGVAIDKIYDPYVQITEREIEYRTSIYNVDDGVDFSTHRIGFGYGFTSSWFGEIYLIGDKTDGESFELEGVELEAKWQLTEQGEYAADWGLLFEVEDERGRDVSEVSTTLLTSRSFGRWTGTANLGLIYEWGRDIDDEVETTFAAQLRYRQRPEFEPAIELYMGQDTRGIGPAAQGIFNFSGRKKMRWETAAIAGVDSVTPDYTLRFLLEYEF